MKLAALIVSAAVACGTAAVAQAADTSSSTTRNSRAEATSQTDTQHEGVGEKIKDTFRKIGEKTRSVFHRAGDATERTADRTRDRADKNDTRAMGAAGSDNDSDRARRDRMDDAYANWQKKGDHSSDKR